MIKKLNDKNIIINNLNFEVILVDANDGNLIVNGFSCFGSINFMKQEIYLDENLKIDKALCTLMHELTHAYIYSFLLNKQKSYNEEEVCEFVGKFGVEIYNKAFHCLFEKVSCM